MKKIAVSLLLLLSVFAKADTVIYINGELAQKDLTKISFDHEHEGNVFIHFSDGSVVSYNMNLIEVMPSGDPTTLKEAGSLFFRIGKVVDDELQISGIQSGERLAIFASDGKLVSESKSEGSNCSLNVKSLSSGVYILRVGRQAVKFVKK